MKLISKRQYRSRWWCSSFQSGTLWQQGGLHGQTMSDEQRGLSAMVFYLDTHFSCVCQIYLGPL